MTSACHSSRILMGFRAAGGRRRTDLERQKSDLLQSPISAWLNAVGHRKKLRSAMRIGNDVMYKAAELGGQNKKCGSKEWNIRFQKDGCEIGMIYWNGSLEETQHLARQISIKCDADAFRISDLTDADGSSEKRPFQDPGNETSATCGPN